MMTSAVPRHIAAPLRLRRLAIVIVSTSACLLAALLFIRGLTSAPAPNIEVRWDASVSESARERLERRFQLMNRGATGDATWSYDLVDTSASNITAMLAEPGVAATTFLNGRTFSVSPDAPQGIARTWVGDRIPVINRPGVMQTVGVILVALIAVGLTVLSSAGRALRVLVANIPAMPTASAVGLTRTIPSLTARSLGAYRVVFATGLFLVVDNLQFGHLPAPGIVQPPDAWLADAAWIGWIANHPPLVGWLETLVSVALLLFGIGFWTRTAYGAVAVGLVVWTLVRLHHTGTHNWAVALITVLCLIPVRWGDGLSLDQWIRRRWYGEPSSVRQGQAYGLAVWLPGLVFGTAMAGAAIAKLYASGLTWIIGGAVKFHFVTDSENAPVTWGLWIASHHWVAVAASAFAVAAEGSVIVAVFARSALLRRFLGVIGLILLLGFYLFQNEVWYAWWFLWACFFVPWDGLFRQLATWIPRQTTWMGSGGDPSTSGVLEFPLRPVHYSVIAVVCALQLTASVLQVEQQPLLSSYPMYSGTYPSTATFDDAGAIKSALRFVTQAPVGEQDISMALERAELDEPLRDVMLGLGRGEPLSPQLRDRVHWISERYRDFTGEPLGLVTLRRDERAFDWSTGRLYSKETDAEIMTLDTDGLTWRVP